MGLRGHGGDRAGLLLLLAIGCSLAALGVAAAPLEDVFTVSGVAVDAEAETAAVARELALAEGQRQAFRRLVERLVLGADQPRRPELAEPALTALVQGIEIQEEKTSSTRYLAKLTIRFKKDEVRQLLRDRALRFSETVAKPILVLPVYQVAGTEVLWDDPNPWRDAWLALEKGDSLISLLVPAGDLADIGAIGPLQALAGDRERLGAIAARYGVEDAMVARASLSFDLRVGAPRLEVSLSQYGRSGDQVIIESFVGDSAEVVDALLARAAREITLQLEESWKRDTQLQFDRRMRLSARVPLSSLGDWLVVRERLDAVSMVVGIELSSLSKTSAQVVLNYLGDPGKLAISLAQRDLELSEEDGFWMLTPLQAPARPVTPAASSTAAE
jgi:hypothetical protein